MKKTPTTRQSITSALSAIALYSSISVTVAAAEPVPQITESTYQSGEFTLQLENLASGGTYYIERTKNLNALPWLRQFSFEGSGNTQIWKDTTVSNAPSAFYRVIREPYHPSVGNVGTLVTRFHDVSGTARIVNNRTIEITDFNYDGTGIVVEIYLSPNSNFSSSVSISDDLIRATPYVNETLTLEIPEGTDLSTYKYISVWCVTAGVSFGDGVLEAPL